MTVAQIIAGLRKLSDPNFVRTREFQLLVFGLYRYLKSKGVKID